MPGLDFSVAASLHRLAAIGIEEPANFPMTRARWHSAEEERQLLLKIYAYGCPAISDSYWSRPLRRTL